PVTENVLEGITRSTFLELAQNELGIPVLERPIDRSELYIADELFLSGTAVGLAPVVRVDHRRVKDGAIGECTRLLQTLYSDIVHGHLAEYRHWVLPVYGTLQKSETSVAELEHTSVA